MEEDKTICNIKCRKAQFDNVKFLSKTRSSMVVLERNQSRKFMKEHSDVTSTSENYFCYWFPKLFGIDEEFIPSSDEEGIFEEPYDSEKLSEAANESTSHEADELTKKSRVDIFDENLREKSEKQKVPKYGRRARAKPILRKENNETFECLCDIDRSFSRHYVPHFGGGVVRPDEEMRTPHFIAFWENFREKAAETSDMDEWSKVLEPKPEDDTPQEKGLLFRPIPKFPGSRRLEMKNFRQQLMASFRPLECREIRRFRMPFSEALYLELQEDLFLDSAHFFKNLIIKDYLASNNPDYVPTLTESKGRMKYLVNFLKIAEKFSRRKEYHKEAIILLKSAKYFNDHNENWWWLAEELYKKAVKVSTKSVIDGGKMEAIARYILGTFLLEAHRVQLAQEHLLRARELSVGKDWNAAIILQSQEKPVYQECSNYLCQALIASSQELRKNGKPEEALPLIHRSYKLCLESRTFRRDIEMETYFELGMTYQALGMLDWAKIAFKRFIEIAKLENFPRSICDGYLELAITYRSEGDMIRCHHSLINYLETAEANQDENLIAFANRYLGEYHLNNGNPKVASEFFNKAFKSFHKQCMESLEVPIQAWKSEFYTLPHDVELSRVLIGLATGEMITKPICNLILKAREAKNKDELLKLIEWKNKKDGISGVGTMNLEDSDILYDVDLADSDFALNAQSETLIEVHPETSVEEAFYRSVRFAADGGDTTLI